MNLLVFLSILFTPTFTPVFAQVSGTAVVAESKPKQDQPVVIESIEGNGLVVVRSPKDPSGQAAKNRPAKTGMTLSVGDTVKTGPKSSVKLRYPDGSKLLIGRSSEVEVQEKQGEIQFNKVYSGYVRGLIRKSSQPQKDSPPRFIIRSRTVVMGVRGTDFLLSDLKNTANADLHTFEGVVEVAKKESTLMEGDGVKVGRNQMVTADATKVGDPVDFSRPEFETQMKKVQPDFNPMVEADLPALTAARDGAPEPDPVPTPLKDEELQKAEIAAAKQEKEATAEAEKVKDKFKNSWLNFQVGPTLVAQFENDSNFLTGSAAWTPRFKLLLPFRASVGFFPVKSRSSGDGILVSELGLQLSFKFLWKLLLEPGIGIQHWSISGDDSATDVVPLLQVAFLLSEGALIERVYFGVSHFGGLRHEQGDFGDSRKISTLQLRAGIGLHF